MGNGNDAVGEIDQVAVGLLTPHGEREPASSVYGATCGSAPNPSWGTGTSNARAYACAIDVLLTPHGERERSCDTKQ